MYWRSTFTRGHGRRQVDGDIYQISSRVAGQVIHVYAQDNTKVNKGDLLIEIDPKDQQVALEQAQAGLASAQADYSQANVNVPITGVTTRTTVQTTAGSDVLSVLHLGASPRRRSRQTPQPPASSQAKANAIKAAKDVDRYTPLVEKDVISRQQYDAAVASARASSAAVRRGRKQPRRQPVRDHRMPSRSSTRLAANAAQAAKNGPEQVKAQQARADASMLAQVKTAQAKVDQALLNLSYTRVVAPSSGVINKKNVSPVGAYLSAGQDLIDHRPAGRSLGHRELQGDAAQEHAGRCQVVELKVDALGGRKFSGKISQIGGATGSRLSLFPAENATGNYVKVVQRIPVRIDFTNLEAGEQATTLSVPVSRSPRTSPSRAPATTRDTVGLRKRSSRAPERQLRSLHS